MSQESSRNAYQVSLSRLASLGNLATEWQELESRIAPPFFLSWLWQSAWLETVKHREIWCIRVYADNQLIALGTGTINVQRIGRLLPVKRFYLHATGVAEQDQQWIEYNDLLCLPSHNDGVKPAVCDALFQQLNVDECIVGVSHIDQLRSWKRDQNWRSLIQTHGYKTALTPSTIEPINQHAWSGNTRYQIRRSRKKLEQQAGALRMESSTTTVQALDYFEQAAEWHIQRWAGTPTASGFTNNTFIQFHKRMMRQDADCATIQLHKISAGSETLGYLYFFCHNDTASFYLSSINPEWMTNTIQPGLVMHQLAMAHYAAAKTKYYDFLAGDARYKRSLSTESYEMAMIAVQSPGLKNTVLDGLRTLKRTLK